MVRTLPHYCAFVSKVGYADPSYDVSSSSLTSWERLTGVAYRPEDMKIRYHNLPVYRGYPLHVVVTERKE